jgi:HSP20 family protein
MPQPANTEVTVRFSELDDIEAEMVHLLQQFMGAKKPFHGFNERAWRPPTDIYETQEALVVTVEIAGVDKESLGVDFRHSLVTVTGNRRHNPDSLQVSYHQMEIKYGAFEIELKLPAGLDTDSAKARYVDGFLSVTIPKRASEPQSVSIEIEG